MSAAKRVGESHYVSDAKQVVSKSLRERRKGSTEGGESVAMSGTKGQPRVAGGPKSPSRRGAAKAASTKNLSKKIFADNVLESKQ